MDSQCFQLNFFIKLTVSTFYIYQFLKMRTQSHQNKSLGIMDQSKKTKLPFIVRKAPIENSIAYEKKGHWSQKEKLKYVIFLQYFKRKFTSKENKKRFYRIFKVMSDFIKTRTHNQCRSHHQKMEKERFQVDSIIKNISSKYHPRVFQEFYQKYQAEIENLIILNFQEQNISKKSQQCLQIAIQSILKQGEKEMKGNSKELQPKVQSNRKLQIKEFKQINIKFEQIQYKLQKSSIEKKQLKMTQQFSESGGQDRCFPKDLSFEFPPRNNINFQNQQSLDLKKKKNFSNININELDGNSVNSSYYMQNLQMRKLQSFNKAVFHYNQMQFQLGNIEECQRQKIVFLNKQQKKSQVQKIFNFDYQNIEWGIPKGCKPF